MHTQKTLGELLQSPDNTIKRNAYSILKRLANCPHERWAPGTGTLSPIYPHHRQCATCGTLKPLGMR